MDRQSDKGTAGVISHSAAGALGNQTTLARTNFTLTVAGYVSVARTNTGALWLSPPLTHPNSGVVVVILRMIRMRWKKTDEQENKQEKAGTEKRK